MESYYISLNCREWIMNFIENNLSKLIFIYFGFQKIISILFLLYFTKLLKFIIFFRTANIKYFKLLKIT